jgi:parallel beta-helix repeat protein
LQNTYKTFLSGRLQVIVITRLVIFVLLLSAFGVLAVGGLQATEVVEEVVWHIRDDATGGDCTRVGTWVAATKTCTLISDSTDHFSIDSDNVTLDGNGITMTGSNTGLDAFEQGAGIAVNVVGRSGVTVKNFTITRYDYAVDFVDTVNSTVTNVTAINNAWAGMSLTGATHNTFTNNTVINNNIDTGICVGFESSYNIFNGNQISSSDRGLYVHTASQHNTITNNSLIGHIQALTFDEFDSYNVVTGNTITGNEVAVLARNASNNNSMTNNIVENNGSGFLFEGVANNLVAGNIIRGNGLQAQVVGGANNSFNSPVSAGGTNQWGDDIPPLEGCAATNPYWESYSDHFNRRLSANIAVTNHAATDASNVVIAVTLNYHGEVSLAQMPISIGTVLAGETKPLVIHYSVPVGSQLLNATIYTSSTVVCEPADSYPASTP